MAQASRLMRRRNRFPAARIGRALLLLAVLSVLGMEAYRFHLVRQVETARQEMEQTRAQADDLEARAEKLAPVKPMVERALAGLLDPLAGNLSHQQLQPLLDGAQAAGVRLMVVAAGNRNRLGRLYGQVLTLQVRGQEAQILQFVRELEQAGPLIRVVAWNLGLGGRPVGDEAEEPAAPGDIAGQFTVLFYHR